MTSATLVLATPFSRIKRDADSRILRTCELLLLVGLRHVHGRVEETTRRRRSHGQRILASASRLIREKGVAKISVAEVMKGAGLTVGRLLRPLRVERGADRRGNPSRRRGDARAPAPGSTKSRRKHAPKPHSGATCPRTTRDATAKGCPLPAVAEELTTWSGEHREALGEQTVARMAAELNRYSLGPAGAIRAISASVWSP